MKRELSRSQKTLLLAAWISLPVAGAAAMLFVPKMIGESGSGRAASAPKVKAAAAVSAEPPISLFSSVERVKAFMDKEAKLDYSDKYLAGVKLVQVESVPRKGQAWAYSFSFKKPRLGGDVVIYHYTDGEIVEFACGP